MKTDEEVRTTKTSDGVSDISITAVRVGYGFGYLSVYFNSKERLEIE
jgi:hypothetical protein